MMNSFLPVLAAGVATMWYLAQTLWSPLLRFAVAEGDEDIKIAPGSFSQPRGEDGAELAARDFLRQKSNGNIDRARDLGARFAHALLRPEGGPLAGEVVGKTPLVQHHIYLLYAYVVSHVITDHSPNSILAQTAQSVFQSEVEAGSGKMAEHINDSVAFSLYIHFERSAGRTDEVGRVFAGLASEQRDKSLVEYGNRLYDKFYSFCLDEIRKTEFVDV